MNTAGMIKIGCCGFREKREDYFHHFEVVEIQKTFYMLPRALTAEKWKSLLSQLKIVNSEIKKFMPCPDMIGQFLQHRWRRISSKFIYKVPVELE